MRVGFRRWTFQVDSTRLRADNGRVKDEQLLKRAEDALAEIDRTQGLIDLHAEVLAAIRIRLYGADKKTLDEVIKAAGELKGKRLEELQIPEKDRSLDDVLKEPPKKRDWPDG